MENTVFFKSHTSPRDAWRITADRSECEVALQIHAGPATLFAFVSPDDLDSVAALLYRAAADARKAAEEAK